MRMKKVIKNRATRQQKKVIIIGAEGKNKTEKIYFRNLERTQGRFHFIFAGGNGTDPENVVKDTIKKVAEEELDFSQGDMAVSFFDLDLDIEKKDQLSNARKISRDGGIRIFTSNPCFELWYLEHFEYTSKPFNSSDELILTLKKYIPDYKKSNLDFSKLYPLTEKAVINCRTLDKYHETNGDYKNSEFNNPRTDVYHFVEMIVRNNCNDIL